MAQWDLLCAREGPREVVSKGYRETSPYARAALALQLFCSPEQTVIPGCISDRGAVWLAAEAAPCQESTGHSVTIVLKSDPNIVPGRLSS